MKDYSELNKKLPDLPEGGFAVTAGDPAGIGPELLPFAVKELTRSNKPVLIFWNAGKSRLKQYFESAPETGHIRFIEIEPENETISRPGKPGPETGRLAFAALETATAYMLEKSGAGLLTAPLSKEYVIAAGEESFSGHTGYLAEKAGKTVIMLMHGKEFSVVPLTEHVPLKNVVQALEKKLNQPELPGLLKKLQSISGYKNTKTAICGLNPHCGENGKIGTEEQDFLIPALERWKKQGLEVEGPVSADSLFQPEIRADYRLILSCYHDQGLIPFKSIVGKSGVNVTVGLPFLRTSPDHGTAFSIAGKGSADPTSMIEAAKFLVREAESWN